jgi:putative sterol carrier protein
MPAHDEGFPDMDMTAITESLRAKVGDSSGLNATLKFDCGDDGVVVIDGRSMPNTVDNDSRDTDCTITITRDNLAALVTGELEPATGFMTGRFKVAGDMSVALKLQRVV